MLVIDSFYRFHFEDSVQIGAPAEAGFAFFDSMESNYLRWHPDHVTFEWRKGRGLAPGNVFYFEERIGGKLLRKETRITDVVPGRSFTFTMVNPLYRFFLPRLSFAFEPNEGGHRFRADLHLKAIGPMGRRLNAKEFDAVDQHMKQEGLNLKGLLEGA